MNNKMFKFSIAPIILLLLIMSAFISDNKQGKDYFEISKNLRIFSSVYDKINTFYVDEPVHGKLMKTGIDAMLKSLDPYTVYIPESDIEDYRFMTTGQYGGIGASIKKIDSLVLITELFENSPAHLSNLKVADIIISVDGIITKDKSISEISSLLKGGLDTDVSIIIYRNNKQIDFTIKRKVIQVPSVPYYGIISENIAYIKLTSFTKTASSELSSALKDLTKDSTIKNVIIDLRGNGGGLLNEAVEIVNLFVPKNQLVVKTKGRIEEINRNYMTMNNPVEENIPLVILIDDYSASASEIVAGSIQDLDRGVIIGVNSFGKGLVQQTKSLNFGSSIKLTVAKYYTPSGRCIQKLDYTNKTDNGNVNEFADSLVKKYYTKNGREVLDSRGIEPDLKVEEFYFSKLSQKLIIEDYIFEYVNNYVKNKDSISVISEFNLNDEEYLDFISFISSKNIDYTSDSKLVFDDLIDIAKREKYYEDNKQLLDNLEKEFKPVLKDDLLRYKKEIILVIENEIISRYYYQSGRIEASLKDDYYIKQVIEVFSDTALYNSILRP